MLIPKSLIIGQFTTISNATTYEHNRKWLTKICHVAYVCKTETTKYYFY